jgi:hypothetical protein
MIVMLSLSLSQDLYELPMSSHIEGYVMVTVGISEKLAVLSRVMMVCKFLYK